MKLLSDYQESILRNEGINFELLKNTILNIKEDELSNLNDLDIEAIEEIKQGIDVKENIIYFVTNNIYNFNFLSILKEKSFKFIIQHIYDTCELTIYDTEKALISEKVSNDFLNEVIEYIEYCM